VTKLIIQIPCFNEAESLPGTLAALPRSVEGVDCIEILVVDDGSTDGTSDVARRHGVHHIVRHLRNRGLAASFQTGLEAALSRGADVIVNTDADGQYPGAAIEALVAPILRQEAEIVIGDRRVGNNIHFGRAKRLLQQLGSTLVRKLSGVKVADAVSGFRALSRAAAQSITITTEFSYTTDMLIQAGRRRLMVVSVPVNTNGTQRPSRLFRSVPEFIARQVVTIARAYATYNPLRTFAWIGGVSAVLGLVPIIRFLVLFMRGEGSGHVQSLVLGGALLVMGVLSALLGILADLIGANRKLLESALRRLHEIEDRLEGRIETSSTDDRKL
jgi:glycosyltransferase involved in cell wall biosynthesis